ncbi:MAG: 2-oxoacid:acceptor oxidoreductase subunit alpha [Candidatus Omnitrophica bacterium]|nr:2-oxoacid:acceptor oxidoreductase subunit alpha [Candidatus Omnitrophota bacterium]
MANVDLTIKIAGEAGQGLHAIGGLLSRVFARGGYHVFANQVVQSRVRGGHNWFSIRVSDRPVHAPCARTDILVAFDKESACHFKELTEDSVVIFDSKSIELSVPSRTALDVPMAELASRAGGNRLMANTVAAAAVLGLLHCDPSELFNFLRRSFGKKDAQTGEANVKAAEAGYDFALKKNEGKRRAGFGPPGQAPKMLIGGSEAVALGALAAGCQFISAYPMSPSTGIMTYLASKAADFHMVVEQSEDEIASINIALGASFAGVRAMTASSGGGFALMAEGLSLAGMIETPIVIVLAQRPAPATGLPTRTAQEDLEFAIHAGHGEFARVVMAPAGIEECFYATARAFHLADKYRIPVIILTDQSLADSFASIDALRPEDVVIERHLMSEEDLKRVQGYKSFLLTKSGVSPRALPGNPYCFVTADSDEHDEDGRITEDCDVTRPRMVEKRNRKTVDLLKEMKGPSWYGPKDARDVLIGWGSTRGVLREAADNLLRDGIKAAAVHFEDLWPLDRKHFGFLKKARFAVVVENNFTGQFANLITRTTGIAMARRISKYDGLPFTAQEVVSAYKRLKKGGRR